MRRCSRRFNPRARVGRDPAGGGESRHHGRFQSTRPRGARHHARGRPSIHHTSFNPRARVGRDARLTMAPSNRASFNPRARVGRDDSRRVIPAGGGVSIHAPAWGATGLPFRSGRCPRRFNPRARVGRDLVSPSTKSTGRGFNPRARVGRDVLFLHSPLDFSRVSIHAPAWGATKFLRASRAAILVSIHAPAWGATEARIVLGFRQAKFQSTRPRGARQSGREIPILFGTVSIHAPAWGATDGDRMRMLQPPVSIHAPAWGATSLMIFLLTSL